MWHAEKQPGPRQPWSFSTGIALLLLAGVTVVMGWIVLMLPNPLGRVVVVFPMAGALLTFYNMSDIIPDNTANEILGMSALIWVSHMGYLVYVNNDSQYIRAFRDGPTEGLRHPAGQNAFKLLFNCRELHTSWAIDPAIHRPSILVQILADASLSVIWCIFITHRNACHSSSPQYNIRTVHQKPRCLLDIWSGALCYMENARVRMRGAFRPSVVPFPAHCLCYRGRCAVHLVPVARYWSGEQRPGERGTPARWVHLGRTVDVLVGA